MTDKTKIINRIQSHPNLKDFLFEEVIIPLGIKKFLEDAHLTEQELEKFIASNKITNKLLSHLLVYLDFDNSDEDMLLGYLEKLKDREEANSTH